MEENTTTFDSPKQETNILISEEGRFLLASGAKWANFISIFAFVLIGLSVICFLFVAMIWRISGFSANEVFSYTPGFGQTYTYVFWSIMLICILIYLILLIPVFHLYRFAKNTRKALAENNAGEMTESFRSLRGSFKSAGIILIAYLALMVLYIISMIAIAAASFPAL